MKKYSIARWSALLGELQRRKVYRVMVGYAVAAWLLLQIGEVTFEPLNLPSWAMPALIFVVVAGFPVSIALSWVFEVTPEGVRLEEKSPAQVADNEPSIAVLPFVDMSREQDQRYLCEGIAEEILTALTMIDGLHVVARSSSFQYSSISGDVRQIGKDLGVKSVLEGSVRKSGDRLRVTAQLVKVADGYHLWSRTFDQGLEDVFAIQDEIARSIAQSLLQTITPRERSSIKTTSSRHFNAYDYYLRGRHFINRFQKNNIEFARQMFREAIEIDPEFALAWAGYADCHSLLIMYADPKAEYRKAAAEASSRALELQPHLAEAHASRGLAYLIANDYEAAEKELEKALQLNPSLYEGYYYRARVKFHEGDLDGAAELFSEATRVRPAEFQARCLRVQILRGMGRLEEAAREAKENIEIIENHLRWNPDDVRAFHLGAGSLLALGDQERARRWLQRAVEIDPDDSILLYNVACNYATMGESDTALDYLEQAVDNGMVSLAWVTNDTDLDSLRSSTRFDALLGRIEELERLSATTPLVAEAVAD